MNTLVFKLTALIFVLIVSTAQGADLRYPPTGKGYLLAARDNGDRRQGASSDRSDRREQEVKPDRGGPSSGYGRGYEEREKERKAKGKEQ